MLALLSPLLGIFGSLLPSIVRIFERRQELRHEIELTKIKIEAARENAKLEIAVANIQADIDEGKSLRSHDSELDGGKFINALRASIRPVITYVFFILFISVKVAAAYVMLKNGQSVPEMLKAVWDVETMSLFSTIIAFWFGSRILEKRDRVYAEMRAPMNVVTNPVSPPPAAVATAKRRGVVDTRPPSGPPPRTD